MTQSPKRVENAAEGFQFAGTGEIYSFTTVQEPPEGFEESAPFILALVKLDEGPVITAQITDVIDASEIAIGDRVEMVTRKLTTEGKRGMIVYGYKFRKMLMRR
ncbi:MAG: OB-fold domain-containing protein [bacterium]|nr:OB-fold domain-containing protein [bacterium]